MICIVKYPFYLKKKEDWKKVTAILHDKKEYVIHIRNLKQPLNRGLVLKKLHKVIKFNVWLKSYININTKLWKNSKNDFENCFCELMRYSAFWKTVENIRTHRDIKLVTTETRRSYLEPERTFTQQNLLPIEIKKHKYLWISQPI